MKIEIYSKPSCTYCINTKMFLQSKELEYTEYTIGKDLTRNEFLEKFPDVRSVPQILIDGVLIGGYEQVKQYFA
jgi:glutaredoxin 3